ncbi:hypothetical protein AVEN_102298-1 [Araneus ventricosus]|uniref:Uncharacterized protein n=1 Tax=Araneus ventricosus TaxID=182803 RepID=A0A4Y2IFS1_ARAVE|nr:hypothetical protein AVEN_102298-1 [Araneus ventricosus]
MHHAARVGQRGNTKTLFKHKVASTKDNGHRWWLSKGIIHYNFLKSVETFTDEKYAKKLTKCIKNCDIYTQQWSIEKDKFFFKTIPIACLTDHLEEVG